LPPVFTLVSCQVYSSTMKMEAIYSSGTSVDFQRTKWQYIPEDRTLQNDVGIASLDNKAITYFDKYIQCGI
jgi:hypothetical protein